MSQTTDQASTISLHEDAVMAAGVHLYLHSALKGCTRLGTAADVTALVAARPPSMLSSGEKKLWGALVSMRDGKTPDVDDLLPGLDTVNQRALTEAVQMWQAAR